MKFIESLTLDAVPVCKYLCDYFCHKKQGHIMLSRRLISRFMRIDEPLSMSSPIVMEFSSDVDPEYLYLHLIDHLVQGDLHDEAKALLLHIHWSIGLLNYRSGALVDLQKQYELALQGRSDTTDLDESLQLCYKSMVMSSSYISSHQETTKLLNAFVLNQLGRLRHCEIVKNENCPLQIYLDECFDWWNLKHKYIPHMYKLPSPEGMYQVIQFYKVIHIPKTSYP